MNKNQAANAPDYSSLTLKRDKHSENCEEIISSKHLKVKILNLDFSFLLNFYIRKAKIFQMLYILTFFNPFFFFSVCLAMKKDLILTSNPPEPSP